MLLFFSLNHLYFEHKIKENQLKMKFQILLFVIQLFIAIVAYNEINARVFYPRIRPPTTKSSRWQFKKLSPQPNKVGA